MSTSRGGGAAEPSRRRAPVALDGCGAFRPVRTCCLVALAVVSLGCGSASDTDGGRDPGADAGGGYDAGGCLDGGVDGGDDGGPPRLVFGSMTVNGTPYELRTGFGMRSALSHLLYLGTDDQVEPRVQVTLMLPGGAGPGFCATCGGPQSLLLAGQWIAGGRVAFFTLNPTCTVRLSEVATATGEDYRGTFSGTLDLEPRSVLDAGFQVMTITDGTFTVRRPF